MSVQLVDGLKLYEEAVTDLSKHINIIEHVLTGSTYILGVGEDVDVLVLAGGQWIPTTNAGYTPSCENHYEDTRFQSYRKGLVNLLVTDDKEYFDAWRWAAEVCKRFLVTDKEMRIKVHTCIKELCA